MKIKQGDAYDIYVVLTDEDGEKISVSNNEAEMVEFTIERLRKTCPGEVVELPGNQWTGTGTVSRLDTYGNYKDMQTIQGTGIQSKFAPGDVINVELGDHTLKPYKYGSTRPIKVMATYYDDVNQKEYLVTDAGPMRAYTEEIESEDVLSTAYLRTFDQYENYVCIFKEGSLVGAGFVEGDVVDIIQTDIPGSTARYVIGRNVIVRRSPVLGAAVDDDEIWFYRSDMLRIPDLTPAGTIPGNLTIKTAMCDMDGFGPFTKFTQSMTISATHGKYAFPLTQQETFAMSGVQPFEARIKFAEQQVVGTSLGVVMVEESTSKEVL